MATFALEETYSREQMEALQLQRLKKQAAYVYENVAPYRKKMDEAGVTPADVRSLKDLALLPFTSKPGTKACLFVLTERKKNLELIFKLKGKTQECVVEVFDRLERKFGSKRFRKIFRSITFDNGGENLDMKGMERSIYTKKPRTTVYYAHPYSAYERGSNEVGNCLIRRFVPKGTDIGMLRVQDVKRIERWMNEYPRRKLNYRSAYEASCFGELFSIGCDN